jgi:hypothetical protein
MCEKLKYCNPRIDECLREEIKKINAIGPYKTLASCCGHGKYPETIVVMYKKSKLVIELHSGTKLMAGPLRNKLGQRKRNRYYRRDNKKDFFIPEVMSVLAGVIARKERIYATFDGEIIKREVIKIE